MKTQTIAIDTDAFAKRILANLPEDYSQRKNDLAALATLLPKEAPARETAEVMLEALVIADDAQRQFLFGKSNGGAK